MPDWLDRIRDQFRPWELSPTRAAELTAQTRAEELAFAKFLVAFHKSPIAALPVAEPAAGIGGEFYQFAAKSLGSQRQLLHEVVRNTKSAERQRLLASLGAELRGLRDCALQPEALPIWQMAAALEGLVNQLGEKASHCTASTLRTVTGGVDLLTELCRPGLPPDLLTSRPLKLLAVDDDPISRRAVALALKRALGAPDLAEDGPSALALAVRDLYDVIFLDVQMPGMDGFELCSAIHETTLNRSTPIVFVTSQSDFDARAQSALSGGSDLLAKPFLTFEITVKALTLALRERLLQRISQAERNAPAAEANTGAPAGATEAARSTNTDVLGLTPISNQDCLPVATIPTQRGRPLQPALGAKANQFRKPARNADDQKLTAEFLSRTAQHLEPMRAALRDAMISEDHTATQQTLAEVYLRINSVTPNGKLVTAHPAIQLGAALEGLLRKLLSDPKNSTPSTLATVATGVELLTELCVPELPADLLVNPPVRLLVVDDDLISRRALTGGLQTSFEKPDQAADGAEALKIAAELPFDAIFLDVCMPGLNGFEVCAKLRASDRNSTTPVIFVSAQVGANTRSRVAASGGNDCLGKPFLTAELTLKALTFALRHRLNTRREPAAEVLEA